MSGADEFGLPAGLHDRLLGRVIRFARSLTNDADPLERVEAVRSTRAEAVRVLMGGTTVNDDRPVWVIRAHGDFVNHRAARPGQAPRRADTLLVMCDADTLDVVDWRTGPPRADLTALGPTYPLDAGE